MRSGVLLVALAACGNREPARSAAPVPTPGLEVLGATVLAPCPVAQPQLGPGLTVERWPLGATPGACIDVVRADATRFTLRLLSQRDDADAPRDALAWLAAFNLSAVINAGMFHASGSPVGLIVADGAARSDHNTKMSGYLAWDPVDAHDPPVALAGRDCGSFDLADLRSRYHSVVQSYRLLGCDGGAISWLDKQPTAAAAIGVDRAGRIVLLHSRTAVPMAELSRALAVHDLTGALFLEGGPEASLVAHGAEGDLAAAGSSRDGTAQPVFLPLPNVIALYPR